MLLKYLPVLFAKALQEARSRWTALGCVAVGISEQDPALRKGIKVRRFTLRVPLHHTNPIIEIIYNYKNYIRLIRILRDISTMERQQIIIVKKVRQIISVFFSGAKPL